MACDYRKISVHNVPNILPCDQMHDKLLIHFLRPRNGGGEVLELLYPTEEQGVAFLTFELEEVAEAVLGKKHLLELDKHKFPLEVRRAADARWKTSEDYMTVETTLDLQLFPDKNVVKALVEKYGFRVCSDTPAGLRIEGVFPALKKLRGELLDILCNDHRSRSFAPSTTSMGCAEKPPHSLSSEMDARTKTMREVGVPSSPKIQEEYSSRMSYTAPGIDRSLGSSGLHGTRVLYSTSSQGPASLPSFVQSSASVHRARAGDEHRTMVPGTEFGNVSLTQNFEGNKFKKPNSAELYSASLLGQRKSSFDVGHSLSIRNPYRIARVSDITVDLDTLKYIQTFKKQELAKILNSASVKMSVEEKGDLGLVTLTSCSSHITSVDMEGVSRDVSKFLSGTGQNLRTQDIPLSGISSEKKVKMVETSTKLANNYLTLTICCDDRFHLIGPSQEVFLLKQDIMALFPPDEDTVRPEPQKARLIGGRDRRDRSCPTSREKRTAKVDDRHVSGSVRSTGNEDAIAGQNTQQSSSETVAAKHNRIKRTASLERTKSKEVSKMPTVPSLADHCTEKSHSNLAERGREKIRSCEKRALKVLDSFRIRK